MTTEQTGLLQIKKFFQSLDNQLSKTLKLAKKHDQNEKATSSCNDKNFTLPSGRRLAEYLAAVLITAVIVTFVAFTFKILWTVSSVEELIEIIQIILPFLIVILTPILGYYFGRRGDDEGDESDED